MQVLDIRIYFRPVRTRDNFGLVIGLGVGIPFFLLTITIITTIIVISVRNKRKSRYHDEHNYDRLVDVLVVIEAVLFI